MTIKLTKEHLVELIKKGFSLDHIALLMLIKEGHNMALFTQENMKLEALLQGLIRKGLVTDENKMTILGQELLDFMATKTVSTIQRTKKVTTKEFDEWWESFPSTDNFEYKGRVFVGSRTIRVQKEKCKLKFNAILNEGEYTAQQIIDATKFLVDLKKQASFSKKSNELTYLHNSLTFLDEDWKPYVGLMKVGVKIDSQQQQVGGGTDI